MYLLDKTIKKNLLRVDLTYNRMLILIFRPLYVEILPFRRAVGTLRILDPRRHFNRLYLDKVPQYRVYTHLGDWEIQAGSELHVCTFVVVHSTATPGEPSHMVGLLLGGLNESQKLQLRHGLNKASADAQAEENASYLERTLVLIYWFPT